MMRNAFVLLFCLIWINVYSQSIVVKGKITDTNQLPLAGVVVKVSQNDNTVGFTTSRKDGSYECKVSAAKGDLIISFRKLYFKEFSKINSSAARTLDVTLSRGDYQLKEAVVKTTPVRAVGDTIKYALGSFLQSGDHSLEDGLKRIPGIKVSDEGTISYMGRNISSFYIEGLNLLGGRYSLATKNIPADKVNGVEVLRHHQANKVDRQELTDNVALNIKLSEKAKLKPFGSYEALAGYMPGKTLYGIGGAGMLFRKTFQLLCTLKLSNYGQMGKNELFDHFGSSQWTTNAETTLPLLSGSRPSMRDTRYLDSNNEQFSFNALQKLTEDNQIKVNANYSHRRGKHKYDVVTQYPETEGNSIIINEQANFLQKEHRADIHLDYRSDKEQRLLENSFIVRGRFADAEAEVLNGQLPNSSSQQTNTYGIANKLSLVRRIKKWKVNFGSEIRYTDTPDNTLDITRVSSFSSDLRQTARSHTFYTQETFSTRYQILPTVNISIPVRLDVKANNLQTQRYADTLAVNALQGWDLSFSTSPMVDYQTRDSRLRATISLPITFLLQDYSNRSRDLDRNFTKFHTGWAFDLIYVVNGNVQWKAASYLSQDFGDIMDLLTGPVQTDYRTIYSRSGIFGQNKTIRNNLSFDWQEPLSFWHLTAKGGYSHGRSNVMAGQNVSNEDLSLMEIARNNTSDAVSGSLSLSKYLYSIKTSISTDISCNWQQNKRLSQNKPVTTYGNGYMVSGNVSTNPIEPIQTSYDLSFQKNTLRGDGAKSVSNRWKQQLRIAYTIKNGIRTQVQGEWQRNSLIDGSYKSFSFLDASAEYKFKKPKILLRMNLNNLLNTRNYSYTSHNQLNTYTYNYRLNGREIVFSVVLN